MREKQLFEAAMTQDEQEQQRSIQEIIDALHHKDALSEVVDALSDSEEAVRRLALRVVQKIGYPQNAPALRPLFELAASGERDDPETQEVLTLLLSMGPPVLAELMRMKNEDASMEDFVEAVTYQLGQFYWRQVEAGNTQLTEKVVPTLAQSPDEVLEFLKYI